MNAVPDWDQLIFNAHAKWKSSPALSQHLLPLPRSIDVVVSLRTEKDLPWWAQALAHGNWLNEWSQRGARVRLVAYLKGVRNRTRLAAMESPHSLFELAPGVKGKNVCMYSHHVEKHYSSLADFTVFTKTNGFHFTAEDLSRLVNCSTRFTDLNHPWLNVYRRRRFFDVVCDERWRNKTMLFEQACPCTRQWNDTVHRHTFDQLLVACEPQLRATAAFRKYVQEQQRRELPLAPLIFERYQEGIFGVARSALLQHDRSLWSALNAECDTEGERDHDTNLAQWALLTIMPDAEREPKRQWHDFPDWLVSESVQAFSDGKTYVHATNRPCELRQDG